MKNAVMFPAQAKTEKPKRRNLREDGRYCVRVTIPQLDGTKKKKSFYSRKSLADAKAQAKAFKEQLSKGLTPEDMDITVSAWRDIWVPMQQGKSKSNDETYETAGDVVVKHIGHMRVREVRKIHLEQIIKSAAGKSTSHIAKLRMVIRGLFGDACENGLCEKDPSRKLKAVEGTYTGHRMLEPWEQELILKHWQVRRAGWWMLLMMLTGMRLGEAAARKGKDIHNEMLTIDSAIVWETNQPTLKNETKTDAGIRSVPLFGTLKSALATLSFEQEEYLMQSTIGSLLSETSLRAAWESALLAFEKIVNGYDVGKQKPRVSKKNPDALKDWITVSWTAHDLRYTYATILYDAGVDEKTAQLWLGHTDPKMTRDLYTQLSKKRKQRSTDAFKTYLEQLNLDASLQSVSESVSDNEK